MAEMITSKKVTHQMLSEARTGAARQSQRPLTPDERLHRVQQLRERRAPVLVRTRRSTFIRQLDEAEGLIRLAMEAASACELVSEEAASTRQAVSDGREAVLAAVTDSRDAVLEPLAAIHDIMTGNVQLTGNPWQGKAQIVQAMTSLKSQRAAICQFERQERAAAKAKAKAKAKATGTPAAPAAELDSCCHESFVTAELHKELCDFLGSLAPLEVLYHGHPVTSRPKRMWSLPEGEKGAFSFYI
jgi:hypothetical protein